MCSSLEVVTLISCNNSHWTKSDVHSCLCLLNCLGPALGRQSANSPGQFQPSTNMEGILHETTPHISPGPLPMEIFSREPRPLYPLSGKCTPSFWYTCPAISIRKAVSDSLITHDLGGIPHIYLVIHVR